LLPKVLAVDPSRTLFTDWCGAAACELGREVGDDAIRVESLILIGWLPAGYAAPALHFPEISEGDSQE
jgi:hypothetical protein